MIYRIVFVLIIGIVSLSMASGKIEGTVKDKATGEPLIGVNIFIEHSTIGSATDREGKYRITGVAPGSHHLVASMIGYRMVHKAITVAESKGLTVDFELEPTIMEMGAVVVTGTATPHIYEDMPVRTEVIPQKLIQQKQAINLAQALSLQTGIRVETNCQNCNFTQVRVLGFDGKYSQILIDGDPVVSSLAGVYGLDHYPQEMISQIEVVKGGGSALYGGGAVAGTINLITRRPLMNQVKLKYQHASTDGAPDQNISAVAEVLSDDHKSGAYIFGSMRKRNPYDFNNDNFSEIGRLLSESIGFNWYLNATENGELLAHFHRVHEERRGGNDFDLPNHEADISEWVEHWRWGGTLRWLHRPNDTFDYRTFYSFSLVDRQTYYGGLAEDTPGARLEALKFYGKTNNPTHVFGTQANLNAGRHLVTAGGQYIWDQIDDKTTASEKYHIDETYTNVGLFLQDNMHFFSEEQLEIVAGGRLDKHSKVGSIIFSPRINVKSQFGTGWTLRGAFTTGFKAPQTFDEDLHIDVLAGEQRIIRNSAQLHEERSRSFTGGIEFQGFVKNKAVLAAVTLFHTRLHDAFAEIPKGTFDGIQVYERINSRGAVARGVELDLGFRPVSTLELRGGLTFKKSKFDEPVLYLSDAPPSTSFMRTPDVYGYSRMSLTLGKSTDLFAAANYTGPAWVPHDRVGEIKKSTSYLEFDIGVSRELRLMGQTKAKISVGIKNLTNSYQRDLDSGPDRDPYYIYGPSLPRTAYAGWEIMF